MFRLSAFFAGGLAVLLAADFLAPPVGTGLASLAPSAVPSVFAARADAPTKLYIVDRTRKGDRLIVSNETIRVPTEPSQPAQTQPSLPAKMLTGCDPAFSPLTVSARLNFPSRCLAENAIVRNSVVALL